MQQPDINQIWQEYIKQAAEAARSLEQQIGIPIRFLIAMPQTIKQQADDTPHTTKGVILYYLDTPQLQPARFVGVYTYLLVFVLKSNPIERVVYLAPTMYPVWTAAHRCAKGEYYLHRIWCDFRWDNIVDIAPLGVVIKQLLTMHEDCIDAVRAVGFEDLGEQLARWLEQQFPEIYPNGVRYAVDYHYIGVAQEWRVFILSDRREVGKALSRSAISYLAPFRTRVNLRFAPQGALMSSDPFTFTVQSEVDITSAGKLQANIVVNSPLGGDIYRAKRAVYNSPQEIADAVRQGVMSTVTNKLRARWEQLRASAQRRPTASIILNAFANTIAHAYTYWWEQWLSIHVGRFVVCVNGEASNHISINKYPNQQATLELGVEVFVKAHTHRQYGAALPTLFARVDCSMRPQQITVQGCTVYLVYEPAQDVRHVYELGNMMVDESAPLTVSDITDLARRLCERLVNALLARRDLQEDVLRELQA